MRISIEGSVASGKSVTLAALAADGWDVVPEPVTEWTELLELFYKDNQRWAFALNTKALLSFVRVPDDPDRTVIVERSPYACRHVFSQLLFNDGAMSATEWNLFRLLHERVGWVPDVVVYLRTTPGVCMSRLQQRGRPAEAPVTIDYLNKLQFQHLNMIKYYPGTVYVVDGNQPLDDVIARVREILQGYRAQ